jgi:membrane-bound lytic murein transglycosylase D
MRLVCAHLAACLVTAFPLLAEEHPTTPAEAVLALDAWIEANVDDPVFEVLSLDRREFRAALRSVQSNLSTQGSADPEPSKADAEHLLSLLNVFDATSPIADQLGAVLEARAASPAAEPSAPETKPADGTHLLFDRWVGIITNRSEPPRARDYLPRVKDIFRSEQVPVELVWVAEVESAFDPHAKSPAGAVGLFQLMPATASSLGLSTFLPDERRDAKKNARAAARYLRYLHNRFDDWHLALAAYNAGPTRVARILRTSDADRYPDIASKLPSETRNYVAKVEATLLVREGVSLNSLGMPSLYSGSATGRTPAGTTEQAN